jgi:hypothetical protein
MSDGKEYGQMNFTLPHDVVPLPSGGVFYKNKKKSVKVGYLTASDENIIIAGLRDDAQKVIYNLIRNKLYETDIRPEELMESDVEAILIFLRNTSFGGDYTIIVTDPQTNKRFETKISLEELDIKKGRLPDPDGTYTVTLPKSGVSCKLRPLTYGELMELQKNVDEYPKGMIPPETQWRLQKMIISINNTDSKEDISKFIEQMPIMDSKFIRNFLDDNEPRLDLRKAVMAPSGESVMVNITFGVTFFRPFI